MVTSSAGDVPESLKDVAGTGLETASSVRIPSKVQGQPSWLSSEPIRTWITWVGLPEEAADDCLEAAGRIVADSDLCQLAAGAHHLLFGGEDADPRIPSWPVTISALGEWTGSFYLILALSGIPYVRTFLEGRGLSEAEAKHCCRDIAIWATVYKTRGVSGAHGYRHPTSPSRWGLGNLRWCHRVLQGNTIRLGRLQFIHRPFRRPFRAWRHQQTGSIRLLAEPGTSFTPDGRVARDGEGAWTATVKESSDALIGSPVVDGYVLPEPVQLDRSHWSEALSPGDPILEIHIPEDGPMGFDACIDSLLQARDRFRTLFPDRPFRAFGCFSWLLDPQFQRILPPASNIVRFQEIWHLLPLGENGRSGLTRIFHTEDLASAPRDTSLQRAVLDHFEQGGGLHGGGGIVFPEDLTPIDTNSLKHGA